MTRKPIWSQRSRSAGSGGLWLVRMALQPMPLRISNWRSNGAAIDGRAEAAEVVVIADAVDLHPPAVDQHAAILGELDRADAEARGGDNRSFAVHGQVRGGHVQLRRAGRPKRRLGERYRLHESRFAAGGHDPLGRLCAVRTTFPSGPIISVHSSTSAA